MSRERKGSGGGTRLFERYPVLKRLGFSAKPKIPMVMQLSATECGAACLTMVLGFFGREMGLEEVRDICGVCRDGVTALSIIKGGEPLGLRGRGIKVDVEQMELLEPGATILHWQFAHFVVLSGVHRRYIEIHDPGVGRRKVPIEQFRKDFTGVALVFETTQLFAAQKRKRVLFATVKRLILASGMVPKIVVMSLVLQVFGLATPVLTGQLIDRVLPRGDFDLLTALIIGLGVMTVFQSIGGLVRGQLLLHMRTNLDVRMTLGFLDHLVSLPYSYFQLRGAGDLMMRLNSNAVVREHLTSSTLSTILDGFFVIVYLVILFMGDSSIAVATLLAGTIDIGVYLLTRRQQRELTTQSLEVDTKAQSYEIELLNSIETLKSTGNEQRAVAHWANLFVDSVNVSLARAQLSMKTDAWLGVLKTAGPLGILATGALRVMHGHLTLGSMLALNAVTGGFLAPLGSLVATAMSLELVRTYLERVNDVLEAEPEQEPGKTRPAPRLTGRVELERVQFRYNKEGAMVVDDVSVKVHAGQFVAIVGRSGSGKTTLANLILGLYKPISGRILFDGIDLMELDLRSVRQQMGIVNQKLSLFGTTIRENIALSDPSLSLEQVTQAAKLACIHDEIMAMPLGYSTPLVDGGGSISGGQKQRLALARALVRQPAVLLLDEATSALDALTEAQVQGSLDKLKCTRIVIAHRLCTVRKADVILVCDKGKIVEAGNHEALLARKGFYAQLVASQMGATQAPAPDANDLVAPAPAPPRQQPPAPQPVVDSGPPRGPSQPPPVPPARPAAPQLPMVRRSLELAEQLTKVGVSRSKEQSASMSAPRQASVREMVTTVGGASGVAAGRAPGPDDAVTQLQPRDFPIRPGGAVLSPVQRAKIENGRE